jgi:hypothetical protein
MTDELLNDDIMQDAFDDATNYTPPPPEYYGEIGIDAWAIAGFVKGSFQPVWDPTNPLHKVKQTIVKMIVIPLPEANMTFNIERDMVVQDRKSGWTNITWKSAQELGIQNARDLKGKFAKVKLTKTGESYRKKDDVTGERTGDLVEKSTIEFLEIYENEEACRTAYLAARGDSVPATEQAPAPAPAQTTILTRENALNVAAAVVKSAKISNEGDAVKVAVAEQFAKMPMVTEHFSVDDAEIMALIEE